MVKEAIFTILSEHLEDIENRLTELNEDIKKLNDALVYIREHEEKCADMSPRNIKLLTDAFVDCDKEVKELTNKWKRVKKLTELLIKKEK